MSRGPRDDDPVREGVLRGVGRNACSYLPEVLRGDVADVLPRELEDPELVRRFAVVGWMARTLRFDDLVRTATLEGAVPREPRETCEDRVGEITRTRDGDRLCDTEPRDL